MMNQKEAVYQAVTNTIEPNEDGGTRFRIIQQACDISVKLPQPANSNCCLMRAAA